MSTRSTNSFEHSGSFDYLNTDFLPPWQMPTPSLSDVDSVPSSASDDPWAELAPSPSNRCRCCIASQFQTDAWHRPPLLRLT
ncbi:hypothetical protein F5148DRAFT_1281541 [Russula earlei]|uniref:Uncharacterized protein n=1 Tax=Russula earlei TaxID=71964 RepID=A0ACC0UGA6_9AGAM|nr:hypothetical protein F5148DRAFT_1281541 [Russula earlei]